MRFHGDVKELGFAIHLLCGLNGWSLADLSRHAGIDRGLLSDYVKGLRTPNSRNLDRILAAFRIGLEFLEQLMPVGRHLRETYQRARAGEAGVLAAGEAAPDLAESIGGAAVAAMAPALLQLSQLEAELAPRAEDRHWAEEVWSRFASLPATDQKLWIEVLLRDERSWALAVRLCVASAAAAADRADEALRLARFALRLAEHAPGDELWSLLLCGWVEPFVANALRVGGDMHAAREAFAHADQNWTRGQGGDPAGLLDASRRLDLKASLLMNKDGQSQEALSLLDQAMAGACSDHTRGRLLLKKARAQEIAGEYEPALATLQQAEPLINASLEPRLPWGLLFSRMVLYCHLDRHQDAAALLPAVETMAASLGTELDGWRLLWLKGRTWLGLGRRDEALAALAKVREHFHTEKIAYDYALVTTELATLHLERGEARIVKELAGEMVWIFKSQQVHEHALAALTLLCQAVEAEEADAALTRRLVKYLYRAQHNSKLHFDG